MIASAAKSSITRSKNSGTNVYLIRIALSCAFISGLYIETTYGLLFAAYPIMLSVYALMLLKSASRGIDKNIALIFLSITLASLLGTVITNGTHSILFSHVASEFTKLLLLLFFLIFYQLQN